MLISKRNSVENRLQGNFIYGVSTGWAFVTFRKWIKAFPYPASGCVNYQSNKITKLKYFSKANHVAMGLSLQGSVRSHPQGSGPPQHPPAPGPRRRPAGKVDAAACSRHAEDGRPSPWVRHEHPGRPAGLPGVPVLQALTVQPASCKNLFTTRRVPPNLHRSHYNFTDHSKQRK